MVLPHRLSQGLVHGRVCLFSNVTVRALLCFLRQGHFGVRTERATSVVACTHLLTRRGVLGRLRALRWDSKVLALRALDFALQVLGFRTFERASSRRPSALREE